ncbi:MAG: plasmid recombination protein [Oscillospiraceae bacterium]|nr:plasmid recombination protein [Oscillospiraceae bacterium]
MLVNKNLRVFFEETFATAIEKYNEKNKSKHADRCTTVGKYFEEQKRKAQETILQLGDADTYKAIVEQFGQSKADNFYKNALKNAFEKWQENNPTLRVFGAYIHMDEQTPHLHLDWLPVTETTRGLTTKVSLEGALKQIGFARSKSDKYDKTPYKRWLSDRRKGYEDFWQQTADELLGKGTIKVLPSEPTASPHKETWEHREVQKGLAKVTDFISGKGAKKVAAAEEIIANAKQINKALCDEGNQRIAAAQRREGAAARIEKAVENKRLALNKNIEDYNIKEEKLRHSAKVLSNRIAKQKITVEKEVQRRLSPHNFAQRHHEENERYLQKQRSIFAVALEQAQQQGKEEQQRKQALFEKAKYKTTKKTKGDWER